MLLSFDYFYALSGSSSLNLYYKVILKGLILSDPTGFICQSNKVNDIPELDFPWTGWQHTPGMLWWFGLSPLHLWSPLLAIWAVPVPVNPLHMGDVYELQVPPERSQGPQRETTEQPVWGWHHLILMCWRLDYHRIGGSVLKCVCVCACTCAWEVILMSLPPLLPQSLIHPPKRGAKVFAAISVHLHASPLTFCWANIHFLC